MRIISYLAHNKIYSLASPHVPLYHSLNKVAVAFHEGIIKKMPTQMHYKEERDTEPVPTHLSLVVYKDKDPPKKQ